MLDSLRDSVEGVLLSSDLFPKMMANELEALRDDNGGVYVYCSGYREGDPLDIKFSYDPCEEGIYFECKSNIRDDLMEIFEDDAGRDDLYKERALLIASELKRLANDIESMYKIGNP